MRYLTLSLCCFLMILTGACERQPQNSAETEGLQLDLNTVLGGNDSDRFLRADTPREFEFPRDHGGHPGFRNEWWYLTGNLWTPEGRRFGYQVTFFRAALKAPTEDTGPVSDWSGNNLWMAHAAITDVEDRRHHSLERFSRENTGLAGVRNDPLRVWLENWSLTATVDNDFPWQLDIRDPDFSLQLTLSPEKAPVLQGDDGLSRKSPAPGNASYYYSLSRLHSEGSLTLGAAEYFLEGDSWLDREWSTSALADDQSGWDWFSLQFDDGRELMYYRLRDRNGHPHPNSAGNWTDRSATQTPVSPEEISLEETRSWQAPDGSDYGTRWRLQYRDKTWIVEAVLEEQFMNHSLPYWEGAVDVLNPDTGMVVGHGYLEMVRGRD